MRGWIGGGGTAGISVAARLLRAPGAPRVTIIDPRDTRRILCDFANVTAGARVAGPPSFGYRP